MRQVRLSFHLLLTVAGTLTVLWAVYAIEPLLERVLYAALGMVLMEAGIWRITRSIFPDERSFRPLRKETEYFIGLVRRLNRHAVAARRNVDGAEEELDRVYGEMLHSVERMRQLAGRTEAELGFRHDPKRKKSDRQLQLVD